MRPDQKRLKVFTGNANPALAREIAAYIGVPLGEAKVSRFSNGEIQVVIDESVRGADIFVVQPTCQPVNKNLMELLIMIDAFRRASARRITAVIPHYGYARQDRKARGREPVTAKLVANLLVTAGAGRILTMDLHAAQIQGFFDIPVDHLMAGPLIADYFRQKGLADLTVVSPDVGGVGRARDLAERLLAPIAIVDNRRPTSPVGVVMNVMGEVKGRTVIMMDDIIDTAGTMISSSQALKNYGVKDVYICSTHGVLSGPAIDLLKDAPIEEVVITNTIPLVPEKKIDKIKVLSVAPIFGEAIIRIYEDLSVSELFE